jgi:hypothetical protein
LTCRWFRLRFHSNWHRICMSSSLGWRN